LPGSGGSPIAKLSSGEKRRKREFLKSFAAYPRAQAPLPPFMKDVTVTVAVRNWSIMVKKIGPPVWLRYELLRVISTAIGPNVDGIRTRSGPLKKVY